MQNQWTKGNPYIFLQDFFIVENLYFLMYTWILNKKASILYKYEKPTDRKTAIFIHYK